MAQPPASDHSTAASPQWLVLLGTVALLLGLVIYLVDRPAAHAMWIPDIGFPASGRQFGAAGEWLPSFLHALALSLLTAATLPIGSRWAYAGCAAWALVDLAFEAGQHAALKEPLAAALRGSGSLGIPRGWTEALTRYLQRGTFDHADVAAVLAGSLCAASMLLLSAARRPG